MKKPDPTRGGGEDVPDDDPTLDPSGEDPRTVGWSDEPGAAGADDDPTIQPADDEATFDQGAGDPTFDQELGAPETLGWAPGDPDAEADPDGMGRTLGLDDADDPPRPTKGRRRLDPPTLDLPPSTSGARSGRSGRWGPPSTIPGGPDEGGEGDYSLAPGTRLGSYVLVAPLGEGAQGSVWRAYNEVADRDFALKFMAAKLARNDAAVRSMRAEAAVLFNLTHRSIVRLNNIERIGPHLFLVMELIEGSNVQDLLSARRHAPDGKQRGFSVAECLWLLEQLAPALDYAASQKVTHRDIKPANIMLTAVVDPERPLLESQANVKLCDFGIALVEQDASSTGRMRPAGTLPFMAPEVLRGEKPTTQADIYSFAATMYALHCGSPPYKGGTMAQMQTRHAAGAPQPPASGNKAFDAALMTGLSAKPEQRQATFDDLLYQASDGRRGKRAAQRARGQRRATAFASLLALGAMFYALDPLGVRRGRAEFDLSGAVGMRDGAPVYRDGLIELAFDYRSPGDEEVDVSVDGAEPFRIGPAEPGSDHYRVVVPLAQQGPHELALVGADRGSLIGQQRVYLDNEVEVIAPAVRLPEPGPFDVSQPVAVDFYLDEPNVDVQDLSGGSTRPLVLERDGARARVLLTIAPDPERDAWEVTRRFRLRDPYGNEVEFPLRFEAFDRGRMLAEIRLEDSTPVESVHLWDVGSELAAVAELERHVGAVERWIEFEERERLGAAARTRRAALEAKLASAPPATIALQLPAGESGDYVTLGADGVRILYTQRHAIELRGTVTDSRSADLPVTTAHLTLDRAPEIARDGGAFSLIVTLDPTEEGELKLALPNNGPIERLRLVQDVAPPEMTLVEPATGTVLGADSVAIELLAQDPASGLARVEVSVGDGAEPVPATDVGDGRWRCTVPLLTEGRSSCRARALDHVGNEAEHQFSVVRDTTAPTWRDTGPAPAASTGQPARFDFEFDEPIDRASAVWRLLGPDRTQVAEGQLTERDVQCVGASVALAISLPFEPCVELAVDLRVSDAVGNGRDVSVTRVVEHDLWGAVPAWIRDNAEPVLDPGELRVLLGDAFEAGEGPYLTTDDGRRYPRCIRHQRTGIEFVFVRGGTFHYGPPTTAPASPGVEVTVSSYYIARTEVSTRQFLSPGDFEGYPRDGRELEDFPVRTNRVDAGRWCARYQFSLPTEAQWEYAASGERDLKYPWGNEFDPIRRHGRQYGRLSSPPPTAPVPVDSFPEGRSWCGALQMTGNLYEVCRDDLDPAVVEPGALDPVGTIDATQQAYRTRGSSFSSKDETLETTYGRLEIPQRGNDKNAGLRPVWEVTQRG